MEYTEEDVKDLEGKEILLKDYSEFLEKEGYLDTDWREETTALITKYLNQCLTSK